jgi:hypothetical protein
MRLGHALEVFLRMLLKSAVNERGPRRAPGYAVLWGAKMRSVMKHAYKCGAIHRALVLRRRFVAFPEARLELALKRKALAGQWNDADDDHYSRLHNWR